VFFGPVYATRSKPGADGVGLTALQSACAVGVPVYALGGVDLERLPEIAACGAYGAAAIGLFETPPESSRWRAAMARVDDWCAATTSPSQLADRRSEIAP
jgi:thiamine monophosphate synthase